MSILENITLKKLQTNTKKGKQISNTTNSIVIRHTNNTISSPENLSSSEDEDKEVKNIPRNTLINDNDLTILDYYKQFNNNSNFNKKSEKIFSFSLLRRNTKDKDGDETEIFNTDNILGNIDNEDYKIEHKQSKQSNKSININNTQSPLKSDTNLPLTIPKKGESSSTFNILNRTDTNLINISKSKKQESNSFLHFKPESNSFIISNKSNKNNDNINNIINFNNIENIERFNSEVSSKVYNQLERINKNNRNNRNIRIGTQINNIEHKKTESIPISVKKFESKSSMNLKTLTVTGQLDSKTLNEEVNIAEKYFNENKESSRDDNISKIFDDKQDQLNNIVFKIVAHNEDNFVYNLIRKNELKHQNNNYLDNGFMSDSIQKIEEVEELSKKEKGIKEQQKLNKINKINDKLVKSIAKMKGDNKKVENEQIRLTCMCSIKKSNK